MQNDSPAAVYNNHSLKKVFGFFISNKNYEVKKHL